MIIIDSKDSNNHAYYYYCHIMTTLSVSSVRLSAFKNHLIQSYNNPKREVEITPFSEEETKLL